MLLKYNGGYNYKFVYRFISVVSLINYVTFSFVTQKSRLGTSTFPFPFLRNTVFTSKLRTYSTSTAPEVANNGKIQVYSIIGCKYCRQAKSQLSQLGLQYDNIDIETTDKNSLNFNEYQRLQYAKKNTVPQIYFDQERIGGYDDLMKIIIDNILDSKLKNNRIEVSKLKQITNDSTVLLQDSLDQHETQDNITGHDAFITTSTEFPYLNYYRATTNNQVQTTTDINALELSVQLDRLSRQLLDNFATVTGDRIDYQAMKKSDLFLEYIKKSQTMSTISLAALAALPEPSRVSFFINLYNCLIIHAYSTIGPPTDNPTARSSFFNGSTGVTYNISGYLFSPDDIEHGILRANSPHPYSTSTSTSYFPIGDPRSVLSLSQLDPRIHFALNCGAVSCPPIKTFGSDPEEALARAASTYLSSEIHFDSQTHTLYLPKICLWYANDFGKTEEEQITRILRMLPRVKIEELNESFASNVPRSGWNPMLTIQDTSDENVVVKSYNIAYNQYNWNANQL